MPAKKKAKPPPQPDDLVRVSAGAYRSGDERFEVEKSDLGWYLVDTSQTNEFGQQLIHGPLPTLDAVRDAIPGARDIKPLLRSQPRAAKGPSEKPTARQKAPPSPPPPPPSWIDALSDKEANEVRRLIRALDKEGVKDAELLVRRHRDDASPVMATRLIESRLAAIIDAQPEKERGAARALVKRVVEALTVDGSSVVPPAPRWVLIDLDADEDVPKRRIQPKL